MGQLNRGNSDVLDVASLPAKRVAATKAELLAWGRRMTTGAPHQGRSGGNEVPAQDVAPAGPQERAAEDVATVPGEPAPTAEPPQIGVRFADLPSPVPTPSRVRRVVIAVIVLVLAAAAFVGGLWWADNQRNAATDSGPGAETVLVLPHG